MWKVILCFAFSYVFVYGQSNIASRAKVVDFDGYFLKLVSETMLEVEEHGWSNLKCADNTVTLNERMYNWMVTGTVNYTNGFVVSIQKIGIDKVQSSASTTSAYVRGSLHFFGLKVGFDVLANLENEGIRRYTGTFLHTSAVWTIAITKDFATGEITTSARVSSLSGGLHRMEYMPADHISQVISRKYTPGNIYDSVDRWGIDVIGPAMLRVSKRIGFPTVCLSC